MLLPTHISASERIIRVHKFDTKNIIITPLGTYVPGTIWRRKFPKFRRYTQVYIVRGIGCFTGIYDYLLLSRPRV